MAFPQIGQALPAQLTDEQKQQTLPTELLESEKGRAMLALSAKDREPIPLYPQLNYKQLWHKLINNNWKSQFATSNSPNALPHWRLA